MTLHKVPNPSSLLLIFKIRMTILSLELGLEFQLRGRLEQEDHKFNDSLGYIVSFRVWPRYCLKRKEKKILSMFFSQIK